MLIAIAGIIYYNREDSKPKLSDSGINLDPATPEQQAESDDQKTQTADNDKADSGQDPENPTLKTVSPVIVDASQYDSAIEVRSYISGIIEDGGTCTATFKKGSQTITRTSSGSKDATTTLCEKITVNRADFPEAGSWSVTLTYTSSTATGASPARTLDIT